MEKEFWINKWQSGQIGFHQNKVMPLLQKYWPQLEIRPRSKVLVPLAGKSLDVIWLSQQNYEVYAIELSKLAVEQFFHENNLDPEITLDGPNTLYKNGNITYICGDIFSLEKSFFDQFAACYDRAALIALPTDMRNKYVNHVYGNFPPNHKTLLLTIDYIQAEMAGPPFALGDELINSLFSKEFSINRLEQRDILEGEPKFKEKGLSKMFTNVYLLDRK